MADTFHRSIRYLRADSGRRNLVVLVAVLLLLGAWGAWLVLGRVTVYAVSSAARLEVDRAAHPVEAPVDGRVTVSKLELDREVRADEVLVELDSKPEQLQLDQERAYLAAIDRQLVVLRAELELRQQATAEEGMSAQKRIAEAKAKEEAGLAAKRLAEQERERTAMLFDAGAAPQAEFDRAESEAEQRRAAVEALRLAPERMSWEQRATQTASRASIEQLRRGAAYLEGEMRTTGAKVKRLEHEIARRRILAPLAGRLGEVANVSVGQYLAAGDRLAVVVPEGSLHVVADFAPGEALGRVRPNAKGRLRLEGFPWTQYGTVPATVRSVGSEPRSGLVRVELSLHPSPESAVPVQHGLPGSVEVEVERISPAVLVLRLAGKLLPAGAGRLPAKPPPGEGPRRDPPPGGAVPGSTAGARAPRGI